MLFAEMGVGQYIIRDTENTSRANEEKLGFVLCTSLLVTISLMFVSFFTLWINPNKTEVYPFISLLVVIPLFAVKQISFSLLQRNYDHKKTAISELISLSLQVSSVLMLANLNKSYWALIIGYIIYHVSSTLICYCYFPVKPRLGDGFDKKLIAFGRTYTFLKLLDTSIRSFDSVVLAINSSASSVGLYQRAINMRNLGHTFAFLPNQMLFYPKISSKKVATARSTLFVTFVQTNFLYSIPVSLFAIFSAKEWTTAIFGSQWAESAILIQILAASIPFKAIDSSWDLLAKSLDRQSATIHLRVSMALLYFGCIFLFSSVSLVHVAVSALSVFVVSSVLSAHKCSKMLQQQAPIFKKILVKHIFYYLTLSISGLILLEYFEAAFGLLAAGPILGFLTSAIYVLITYDRL
jgi:O-antigen/teichoic acid export membrane protein